MRRRQILYDRYQSSPFLPFRTQIGKSRLLRTCDMISGKHSQVLVENVYFMRVSYHADINYVQKYHNSLYIYTYTHCVLISTRYTDSITLTTGMPL